MKNSVEVIKSRKVERINSKEMIQRNGSVSWKTEYWKLLLLKEKREKNERK